MPHYPPIPVTLPDHVSHGTSWESDVKPVRNTEIDTMESGAQHAYVTSTKDWFDVTFVTLIYHDNDRLLPDAIDAFYASNRLQENLTFDCKGHRYMGGFTERPAVEQQQGFGIWKVTAKFRAARI